MSQYLALPELPLIAILRGLPPADAAATGALLYDIGYRVIEVPLNRPGAAESLAILKKTLPADVLLGAGTVLAPEQVAQAAELGCQLIVSPDCNPEVIRATVAAGLWSLPGISSPTEAFVALRAGAHGLKAFPAEAILPPVIHAWRSVLPMEVPLIPVGGITRLGMADHVHAGASGFGIDSTLYSPDRSVDELTKRARAFVDAWRQIEH
ncbi:2-dehydro-3-deoxy-6-phosphogalactonate aldolase [Uliginosibacterium sp. sgz301328]|uniref:2-dehydro-3-deoxy-6-phosphogalactonate aldolase n=1 Tax=Uliginosibacterium sp. sgz301328 TaxID=3243764 RepID=UPI00359EA0DD